MPQHLAQLQRATILIIWDNLNTIRFIKAVEYSTAFLFMEMNILNKNHEL